MLESLVLRDHHWAVEDLAELPTDDGSRYEIIDGVLVLSGAPRYQRGGDMTGADAFVAELPFPVRVVPAELVR